MALHTLEATAASPEVMITNARDSEPPKTRANLLKPVPTNAYIDALRGVGFEYGGSFPGILWRNIVFSNLNETSVVIRKDNHDIPVRLRHVDDDGSRLLVENGDQLELVDIEAFRQANRIQTLKIFSVSDGPSGGIQSVKEYPVPFSFRATFKNLFARTSR